MKPITAPASPRARVVKFLEEFRDAPNDADIEVRIGSDGTGKPAILVTIGGSDHAFMVPEARKLADIMEEVMRKQSDNPEVATLPNLIMCLRAGCDKAERDN